MLAASVFGHSAVELREQIALAVEQGADAVELRLDLCDGVGDEDVRQLRDGEGPPVPLILTIRSIAEGGGWDGDDSDRVSRLIELGPYADYIDVELELWRRSANVRQKIGLALERAGHVSQVGGVEQIGHAGRRRLILSKHDLANRPASLHQDVLEMVTAEECFAPKIAWRARTVRDNFEALELMRAGPKRPIVICMGEEGVASRVLAKKFGAFATFAAVEAGRGTASGQPALAEFKLVYRWDGITESTKVYGLIGDPVSHSLSPRIHNAAFGVSGVDAVYLPFRVDPSYESFKAFLVETLARPWADFRGFSVTIPHKENALRFIKESGGQLDDLAARLGAVNTLKLDGGGRVTAFNTDGAALLSAICELCGCESAALRGKSVVVLGAGGVARAAVGMLTQSGADVRVVNRNVERGRALADAFGCRFEAWESRENSGGWLLVNCTSVGLMEDASPISAGALGAYSFVFDTIYQHGGTALVRDAIARGVSAAGGMGMFVKQAAAQFSLWTGRPAPLSRMAQAVMAAQEAEK